MIRKTLKAVGLFLVAFLIGCPGTLTKELGTELAAPVSVAVDPASNRAYVVNSNSGVEFDGASLSILDITSPTVPVLVSLGANPISIPNLSGQIYLNTASKLAFVTNRESDNDQDVIDALLRVNLDEASATFGTVDSFSQERDPFGIACCDSSGKGFVVNSGGTLVSFDPGSPSSTVSLSLSVTLSTGLVSGKNAAEVALTTDQAFVTNRSGVVYAISTPEIGTGANPIDTVLTGAGSARGIAVDATNIYIVDGTTTDPLLRVVPRSSVPPVSPDSPTINEVAISSVQSAAISVSHDPHEVVLFGGRAYVSNRGDDTVSVINLSLSSLETTISVGDEPFGLAAFTSGGSNYLYVTELVSNSLSIIDLSSNTVVATFSP